MKAKAIITLMLSLTLVGLGIYVQTTDIYNAFMRGLMSAGSIIPGISYSCIAILILVKG